MTRLVAVLGYSDASTDELHPICNARVARAAVEARPDDVVLFSGWARGRTTPAEGELMAACWTSPARELLVDRRARTTLGNVVAIARAARRVDADEVVLVTSSWHARRASALASAALLRSATRLRVVTADDRPSHARRMREAASWLVVPVLAVAAARIR